MLTGEGMLMAINSPFLVIHDNKESHIIEQHIMESNQLTSHYLMFKLVIVADHIQHLNLSFNFSIKSHHTGHKYKLNFRTLQQEFATTLLVQNYINPKFNNNF